jgi:DNA polymerase elongation subunit (family B)
MTSKHNNLIFQIIDWNTYHQSTSINDITINTDNTNNQNDDISDDDSDNSDNDNSDNDNSNDDNSDDDSENTEENIETYKKKGDLVYRIRLFGRTENNESVMLEVCDFNPYFYFEVPEDWDYKEVRMLMIYIKNNIKYKTKNGKMMNSKSIYSGLIKYELIKQKKFRYFTAYKDFKFVKLIFKNMITFKMFEKYLTRYKIKNKTLFSTPQKLTLYESNIEPFIRFMHLRNINSCGWIQVNNLINYDSKVSNCDIEYLVNWQDINPYQKSDIQKFIILSYDIECMSYSGLFPRAEDNDPIIQIGLVFSYYGENEPIKNKTNPRIKYGRIILTLNGCSEINEPDTDDSNKILVKNYNTEDKLLLAFSKYVRKYDPDIITGYNINGFDFEYMKKRAEKLKILNKFNQFGRIKKQSCNYIEKKLSSSGLGDNLLKYFDMTGRVIIDLMKVAQRDFKLDSYKLDYVSANFIKQSIKKIENNNNNTLIYTDSVYGIRQDQYIHIVYNDGLNDNKCDGKFKILKIDTNNKTLLINNIIPSEVFEGKNKVYWSHAKDDISATELFKLYKGTDDDRAIIAKYCIQDCVLVIKLMDKLQIMNNNVGMANVCHVPLTYIFMRGQGIKILSLVSKKCLKENHLLPKLKNKSSLDNTDNNKKEENDYDSDEEEETTNGYEGAKVFDPNELRTTGVHYEPIPVLDYSSLYPSSMIYINISHETLLEDNKDERYNKLPGYIYYTVKYDEKDEEGRIVNNKTCIYAKKSNGEKGILPEILDELLKKRGEMKKLMEKAEEEGNKFLKNIYDGLQLAYKVTANSLYGQVGAGTSAVYLKELAASTTATGRNMLEYSKDFIEGVFTKSINLALTDKEKYYEYTKDIFSYMDNRWIYETVDYNIDKNKGLKIIKHKDENENNKIILKMQNDFYDTVHKFLDENIEVRPKIIYGDTDSVFFKPYLVNKKTNMLIIDEISNIEDKEERKKQELRLLEKCINMGQLAGKAICFVLPEPEKQVYEKTLWPFILLTKKRYVGNLYESDVKKYYQKSMGIVLKRRDNAKIVKIVVGGIVNYILNERSNMGAIEYTKKLLNNIVNNKYPMEKYVISKTLKGTYKGTDKINNEKGTWKWDEVNCQLAHVNLCQRMAQRDPGNKPEINERIPYVYIVPNKKVELQSDRIEHVKYVEDYNNVLNIYNNYIKTENIEISKYNEIVDKYNKVVGNTTKENEKMIKIKEIDDIKKNKKKNIEIDYLFYITNQIMKPSIQFLELIAENSSDIFNIYITNENNRRKGLKSIIDDYDEFEKVKLINNNNKNNSSINTKNITNTMKKFDNINDSKKNNSKNIKQKIKININSITLKLN